MNLSKKPPNPLIFGILGIVCLVVWADAPTIVVADDGAGTVTVDRSGPLKDDTRTVADIALTYDFIDDAKLAGPAIVDRKGNYNINITTECSAKYRISGVIIRQQSSYIVYWQYSS